LVGTIGSGPRLFVGGEFGSAGGISTNNIAAWDGSAWSSMGSGLSGSGSSVGAVHAIAIYDDGAGPALFAGGWFTDAGGSPASHVAKWDGSTWSPLGSGLAGALTDVRALVVFDDGTGPALYVGGSFTSAGGAPAEDLARWDGSSWTALPPLTNGAGINA